MKAVKDIRVERLRPGYANQASGRSRTIPVAGERPTMKASEIYVLAVAVFVALLFGYTAINKIIAYDRFVFQMRLAPMPLMQAAAPFLGVAVPAVELTILAFLIPDATRYRALVASLFLMLSFEAYIIWMRSTGLDLPCTCGGIISRMSWFGHMVFNASVIGLLASAVYLDKKKWWNRKIGVLFSGIRRLWKRIFTKGKKRKTRQKAEIASWPSSGSNILRHHKR